MPWEILMNCSFKLSEAEVVRAMQLHGKGTLKTLAALSSLLVVLLLVGIFTSYKGIGFSGAIGGIAGYYASLYLLIPFHAKRQYRQRRGIRNEIFMSTSGHGINFKGESGESKLLWSDIHKWKVGKGIYLLYVSSNMYHMVPCRALSNENELSTLLNEHVGSKVA